MAPGGMIILINAAAMKKVMKSTFFLHGKIPVYTYLSFVKSSSHEKEYIYSNMFAHQP